ncbi:MAG: A/G-specific adenine glycosylase [Cellvibrionaceae bacterium]
MQFSDQVLHWFDINGRKNLPWQKNRNAYRIWVSEIMLQQTQVATVIPYFQRFTTRFPKIQDLAAASQEQVLQLWAGLGYYARGRNLHKCAGVVVDQYQGKFPKTVEELEELPGIGRSTAAAIVSLAYDKKATIMDGNVKRVLARYFAIDAWPGQSVIAKRLWQLAEELTPDKRNADYTQAMMDLGAMLCKRSKPQCEQCPVRGKCIAYRKATPEAYPGKKPRLEKPVKAAQFLILQNFQGEILLEKRPPSGIWGGMWGLPLLEVSQNAKKHIQNTIGEVDGFEEWTKFRHTFSHYHLDIQPVHLRILKTNPERAEKNQSWFPIESWSQLGVPAPVKKILEALAKAERGGNVPSC